VQQLTGLDAAFLALDTATSTGHVGGVHISDPHPGPPLTLQRLTDLVAERLPLLPPMRRRVVEVPFGIAPPYWVDDRDFDLEFHVRELALPAPGNRQQLAEQIARIHSRPLDRSRPLWEMYLIQGLEHDQIATYAKLHHAMIDGIAGNEVTAALLDLSPDGRQVPPEQTWASERVPGSLGLLVRGGLSFAARPEQGLRLATQLLRSARGVAGVLAPRLPGLGRLPLARAIAGDEEGLLSQVGVRAPATPFNRSISPHRRVAFVSVSLATVKKVKDAAGMTVNDVVLAMCAGAVRHWLRDHDALPEDPLVAALPVSIRVPDTHGGFGNRVSMMLSVLPTHVADPLTRMAIAHQATQLAKEQHNALPATLLTDVTQFGMPALFGLAVRANARLRLMERVNPFNLIISNVPGPQVQLYLAGHPVRATYPVSAITDGQGLNITVLSYNGEVHFGLIADRDLVPDLDRLAAYLSEELDTLATAPTSTRRRRRSATTNRRTRSGASFPT